MADGDNLGYYRSSQGSITGFTPENTTPSNPILAKVGWSTEQLRAYLQNEFGLNFLSSEWIQRVETLMNDHINNLDNPHHTTLAQIVNDIIGQAVGSVTPGTVPSTIPFFSYDAEIPLSLGTIFPATYASQNLWRRTEGGWFVDIADETSTTGIDTAHGPAGLPLFGSMSSITPSDWYDLPAIGLNTSLAVEEDPTLVYPFPFRVITETPVYAQFGIDIPMNQNLQVGYTTAFLIRPSAAAGKVRIFQPSDLTNYVELDLENGQCVVYAETMQATSRKYSDGVIRIAVSFISSSILADNKLRVVHINEGSVADGFRQGSLGRTIFYIAVPQTTIASLYQPFIVDLDADAMCPTLVTDMTSLGVPITMGSFILTMSVLLEPSLPLASVNDSTIFSMGGLVISRDQTMITVSLNGDSIFTSLISEGVDKFSLSYSPTKIIFKDFDNARQSVTGTYAPLSTTTMTFGPFGGYLRYAALYPQSDDEQVLEYLTNG